MDGQNEVDISNNNVTPLWRRRTAHQVSLHAKSKPRPQSYQSSTGVLFTDFPVEDRDMFTLTQPAETIITSPDKKSAEKSPLHFSCSLSSVPNGKVRLPESNCISPGLSDRTSQVLKMVSNNSRNCTANGSVSSAGSKLVHSARVSDQSSHSPEKEQIVFTSRLGFSPTEIVHSPNNNKSTASAFQPSQPSKTSERAPVCLSPSSEQQHLPLQRLTSNENELTEAQPVVLSTNSPAALKMGKQQIIPKSLASEIKVTNKHSSQNGEPNRRALKVRSMVETVNAPLVAGKDEEGDVDSPGMLRRGLRSTSYRRAVVSGVEFDSTANFKKKNRMSQPVLKAVVEDKEKSSSLGRIKKYISCLGVCTCTLEEGDERVRTPFPIYVLCLTCSGSYMMMEEIQFSYVRSDLICPGHFLPLRMEFCENVRGENLVTLELE
ncbi:UNVERIFIED_CONTAM: hypothetical protein K2H54_057681 [Gekko kuhli]